MKRLLLCTFQCWPPYDSFCLMKCGQKGECTSSSPDLKCHCLFKLIQWVILTSPKVITIPTSWASEWITREWSEFWSSREADSPGLKCENKYLLLNDIGMVRLFYMQTKWTNTGTWWLWELIRLLGVDSPYTWSLDTFPVIS